MIQQVYFNDFLDTFKKSDTYKDNFSYDGLKALFDYLENYEEETGEPIDFDMVALCCDWSEYDNAIEAASDHFTFEGMTYDENDGHELKTIEEVEDEAQKFLEDNTTVIDCDNGHIIIQQF